MTTDTTTTAAAAARIRAARDAAGAAQAAFEQAIRDEVAADRITPSDVARALGTKNRQRVYAILGRGDDGAAPTNPPLRPVVYLRGAGRPDAVWTRVREAMWARGWTTISDRTSAWHLARGGTPVVLCDFSADLDHPSPAPGGGTWFGYDRYVVVGKVRAKYGDDGEAMLPRINGGEHPIRLGDDVDEHALARWVAEAFAD
ncbi:hypothetical protein [Nocardia farcinica]|uniref:hypothetical protein n=1 Tax=Nocardia farcinica TaxID=37329 RepID=UPI001E4DA1EE|nr:hypothetical protein [Nocardia farcinica]UEX21222.1 hypothetical protein LMJ57_19675 [Nocardia farcinica]